MKRMTPNEYAEYLIKLFGNKEDAVKCVNEIINEIKVWKKQPAYFWQVIEKINNY